MPIDKAEVKEGCAAHGQRKAQGGDEGDEGIVSTKKLVQKSKGASSDIS